VGAPARRLCALTSERAYLFPHPALTCDLVTASPRPTRNHDSHCDLGSAACQPSAEAGAGPIAERAGKMAIASWCHQVTG